jgi:hypothetical protein
MRLLKTFRKSFTALLLFVGIAAVFSVPGLVRCSGEVDSSSQYASINE